MEGLPATLSDALGELSMKRLSLVSLILAAACAASLSQQPLMTAWYAFPGENNLKIIQAIKDRLQTVVDKSAAPEAALTAMSADVTKLLPK